MFGVGEYACGDMRLCSLSASLFSMSDGFSKPHTSKLSAAMVLVTLGIVYGDIGTSPLYVLKAIVGDEPIARDLILGGLSCIFWTLTLQTTFKYVFLTLRADNKGEGGIFSLYTLVRRRHPYLFIPALIGGGALLADGVITPPISVSSAIEGLTILMPGISTVPIVVAILAALFAVQRFGTKHVGTSFGPVMLVWFSTLAILGLSFLIHDPSVLWALSPHYAIELLTQHPGGFWVLGAVFLCTTGAEALYSDLGHCGRLNITVGWGLVKSSLLLNYFGQGAWLLSQVGTPLGDRNPFYMIMPDWFLVPGIIIATIAAIVASQALISGSFTLVNEAMRLYLFPKFRVLFPTDERGQLYVPAVNFFLWVGCTACVLYFQKSSNMEAAYGLAITLAMGMTTILLTAWLRQRGVPLFLIVLFVVVYGAIEISFLAANLRKFPEGGYFTVILGGSLVVAMAIWNRASALKKTFTEYVSLEEYLPVLQELSNDTAVAKKATNLVYLTSSPYPPMIEEKVVYSLFRKDPKRADRYWFIHVHVVDDPLTCEYEVTHLIPNKAIRVDFSLGFRVEPRINLLFRRVVEDLTASGEIDLASNYPSLRRFEIPGDFRFVVLEKALTYDTELPFLLRLVMLGYRFLKQFAISEVQSFGLDTSSVIVEKVPLFIGPATPIELNRVTSS